MMMNDIATIKEIGLLFYYSHSHYIMFSINLPWKPKQANIFTATHASL